MGREQRRSGWCDRKYNTGAETHPVTSFPLYIHHPNMTHVEALSVGERGGFCCSAAVPVNTGPMNSFIYCQACMRSHLNPRDLVSKLSKDMSLSSREKKYGTPLLRLKVTVKRAEGTHFSCVQDAKGWFRILQSPCTAAMKRCRELHSPGGR